MNLVKLRSKWVDISRDGGKRRTAASARSIELWAVWARCSHEGNCCAIRGPFTKQVFTLTKWQVVAWSDEGHADWRQWLVQEWVLNSIWNYLKTTFPQRFVHFYFNPIFPTLWHLLTISAVSRKPIPIFQHTTNLTFYHLLLIFHNLWGCLWRWKVEKRERENADKPVSIIVRCFLYLKWVLLRLVDKKQMQRRRMSYLSAVKQRGSGEECTEVGHLSRKNTQQALRIVHMKIIYFCNFTG